MPTNQVGSFITHANYLRAFATIAGFDHPATNRLHVLTDLKQRCQASPMYQGLTERTVDLVQLRRSLNNAWATELVLGIAGRVSPSDAFIRVANNWGAVQLYYVLYHGTQAYQVATGNPRPKSHPATQKISANTWSRVDSLPPWSLAADRSGYAHFLAGWTPDNAVGTFTPCTATTAWDLAATALRSTRRDAIDQEYKNERDKRTKKRVKDWNAQEAVRLTEGKKPRKARHFPKANLSADDRAAISGQVRAHVLIDYLYRLRIKTNYVDSDMFTEGPQDDASSALVNEDLSNLASASMLVNELHIARLVGPANFVQIADAWLHSLANVPPHLQMGLMTRRQLLP